MLEITTDKSKRTKKCLIDGYTYAVRKPGAGESLSMQLDGREITKLSKKKELSQDEEVTMELLTSKTLRLCLGLFDSLGNKDAEDYINSLDVETLLEVISQIFNEIAIDEPEPAKAT